MPYHDIDFFYINAWRRMCGMEEITYNEGAPDPNILTKMQNTEWSQEFELIVRKLDANSKFINEELIKLQHNRLVLGAMRYGKMSHRGLPLPKGKPVYDRVGNSIKRLKVYIETKNSDMLADIANFMLLEYEEGTNTLEKLNFVPLCKAHDFVKYAMWHLECMQKDSVVNHAFNVFIAMHAEYTFGDHKMISTDGHDFHTPVKH
jgi:hypothetical protein